MLRQMALFSGDIQQLGEFPKDASVTNHEVRHGDILIFATDGVWDNLSPQDALQIVSKQMDIHGGWIDSEQGIQVGTDLVELTEDGGIATGEANTLQGVLAQAIVSEAKLASEDTKRDGPFAREVQRYYPQERWRGGKVDDICVVVAIAVEGTA
jgi:protein phosphatase PTC7